MKLLPGKRLRLLLPVLAGLAWFLRKRLAERRAADLETLTIPAPVRPTPPPRPSPQPPTLTPPPTPPPTLTPPSSPTPPPSPSVQPVVSAPPVPPSPAVVEDPVAPEAPAATPVDGTAPADPPHGPGSAVPLADGSAPSADYTIKGNASSMLYHTPASPYYGRTKAEVWFRTEQDAITAGFTGWAPRSRVNRSG